MTPEMNAVAVGPPYPARTQVLAALFLLLGWGIVASLQLETGWTEFFDVDNRNPLTAVLVGLSPFLLFGIAFLTLRSIPCEASKRESHFLCAALPALLVAAFLVAVAAPLYEQVAAALGTFEDDRLSIWRGIQSAGLALFLGVTLIAPLQFLGRGASATPTSAVGGENRRISAADRA
jgi:hypothetical protein